MDNLYKSYSYSYFLEEQKKTQQKKEFEQNLIGIFFKIGVSIAMLGTIIGSLFVAWLLNCFGFYNGVFAPFLQPLVTFNLSIGFYYGAFVVIGLICWIVSAIFNHK